MVVTPALVEGGAAPIPQQARETAATPLRATHSPAQHEQSRKVTRRCTAGLQVLPFHQELFRHCDCGAHAQQSHQMPSNHTNGKSASTSYENDLVRFYPLVHSCSNDRRWAIRFVAARIDFIFVSSDRSKANLPADPQSKRAQQQNALTGGQSLLALTDQVEAWGKWKPPDSRSSKDAVISDPVTIKQEETELSKASSARASPS